MGQEQENRQSPNPNGRRGIPGNKSVAIKEAIETAFAEVNQEGRYLVQLAEDRPELFVGLLKSVIPQQVDMGITERIQVIERVMIGPGDARASLPHIQIIESTPVLPESIEDMEDL